MRNAFSAIMLLGSVTLAVLGSAEYAIAAGIWAAVFAIWDTRDEIKKAAK